MKRANAPEAGRHLFRLGPAVSTEEATKHVSIGKDSIYRWIDRKALPAHKVGRPWEARASEVDARVCAGGTASEGLDSRIGDAQG